MNKYTKRPIEIEAVQLTRENLSEVAHWINDSVAPEKKGDPAATTTAYEDITRPGLVIRTWEGEMLAEFGDWIIREPFSTADRQFYPCKPSIFEATYDASEA